jgi:hypothetical protein
MGTSMTAMGTPMMEHARAAMTLYRIMFTSSLPDCFVIWSSNQSYDGEY